MPDRLGHIAKKPHVAVIGAGVIGLGIAWRLAARGVAVAVFDKGAAGSGASHAAAGMLAACCEAEPGEEALVALGVVAYLFSRNPTRPGMWVATGLVAGGAFGNLIDRIRLGAVTDFVELPSWPPFNLADASISAGVIVLIVIYTREGEREPSGG